MSRRAGILLIVAFAASILVVLPVQAKATNVSKDYQPVNSLIENASAVTKHNCPDLPRSRYLDTMDAIPGYDIVVGYQLLMSSTESTAIRQSLEHFR
jgi:hypothetical protein